MKLSAPHSQHAVVHPPNRSDGGGLLGLSVRTNGIWSIVGNGAFAASQLGILVVLARLGTEELVGQYALGLALTSPIFVFFALQLRTLLATHAGDDSDLGAFIAVRVVSTAAATALAALIGWQFMSPGATSIALAIVVSKAVDSLHDLVYGVFWRSNRMDYIAISLLLRGIVGLVAFALTFHFTSSTSAAVLALSATWLVVFLVYDLPVANRLATKKLFTWSAFHLSSTAARRLIWLGIPGGMLSWLASLHTAVPRYFVQQGFGEGALGVYCALASLFVGLELAIVSFNHAALPRLAKFAAFDQTAALSRLVRQLTSFGVALGIVMAIGSLLFGQSIISLIYGANYAQHSDVLAILTIGFAIRTATMPTAMTLRAVNAFWSLVAVQFFAILGLFAACAVLIPRYGLQGCAAAYVVGCALDGLGRTALHYLLVVRPAAPNTYVAELSHAA